MIDFLVESFLEHVAGVDVYSDGPRGQKTSVFIETNSIIL